MSKKRRSLLLLVLPAIVAVVMRLWFATCRVRVNGAENFVLPGEENERPQIASFWHYSIIFILYQMRRYEATVMVSASSDGDYLARLARLLGYRVERGSSHRRGVAALKLMIRAMKGGSSCALVADGSRGPARIAQPGALLLAAKTGHPVVPIVWSASRCFTIGSWDRMAFPLPFSRVEFFFGRPLTVPQGLKVDALEEWRQELENRLNSLYREAWIKFDKTKHYE